MACHHNAPSNSVLHFARFDATCSGTKTVNTPQPFFDFEWPVAPDYVWVEWLDAEGKPVRPSDFDLHHPTTTAVFREKEGQETGPVLKLVEGPSVLIHPMDRSHATLFRRFAELDATNMDAILAFVRRTGWLGVAPRPHQSHRRPDGSYHHAEGEPHLLWVLEIAKMREAIWLWEHPKFAKRELKKLEWLFDSHLQHVQGRIRFPADGPGQLRFAPTTLLAAMWLQLAMAVAGEKEFVKCKFCSRQIEISTAESGFRTNREFCSQSCKTKDYRHRKRTALRLADARTPMSKIAAKVQTPVATVQRWLAAQKTSSRASKGAK